MADTVNKPKLQLRSGISVNGDKTPSPATKLLLSHGKPNFTIQRSPSRVQENGTTNGNSEVQNNGNNNYNPYKKVSVGVSSNVIVQSTKFNGVFKPSNVNVSASNKQPQQSDAENEASTVVLRRPPVTEPAIKDNEDESVPEFIRRQRRIQERLAQQNILDFESRRSGYFTHVIVSPTTTSANRTSFVETMASPAIVPSLEIPPPKREESVTEETAAEQQAEAQQITQTHLEETTQQHEQNGHHVEEEEEVAKAIEEVNKAVAGEEDESTETEATPTHGNITTDNEATSEPVPVAAKRASVVLEETITAVATPTAAVIDEPTEQNIVHAEVAVTSAIETTEQTNDQHDNSAEEPLTNGSSQHHEVEVIENGITISHTNGHIANDGPRIPSPDPSGALGVNYEPKTVVSFSKDLGAEINMYPDTVKVVSNVTSQEQNKAPVDEQLQELSKLKFDIKADEQDVQVTPVLRAD